METLDSLETADDSSENSAIVKSEDESPTHGNGSRSPPPNCAICLGRCKNKSFTDSCLHQFCFKCLVTWSKVKTECPLCKQTFKSIIHNVKSNHQYEEYRVQQPPQQQRGLDFSDLFNAARRFRYRTTLTLPRRESMAIRQFLMHYPLSALMNELPARAAPRERARRTPADFRRTVYRHNLWARPLPDFTGRFRDCSPDFFRYNDSQVHRLVPWLNRELLYLLNENSAHTAYVLDRVLQLLPQHAIMSPEFRAEMHRYLGDRTDHFLHEFQCFASTPYDITGYDQHVQYQTDARLAGPGLVSQVLSSSDSESHDSDIVVVSSSHAADAAPAAGAGPAAGSAGPAAGPSRPAAPAAPAYPPPAVVPIETISHSDSDSDSEVVVVGYIKPPHQRTPELVDLLASDSDVVVHEPDEPAAEPPPEPLVRVKLSVRRPSARDSSSGSGARTPPRPARRRRRARAPADDAYSPASTPSDDDSDADDSERSAAGPPGRRRREARRKPKKKSRRGGSSRARADGRESRRGKEAKKAADGGRKSKGKSKNGKDVKSSKVESSAAPSTATPAPALDEAGPSGHESRSKRKRSAEPTTAPAPGDAGPSGLQQGGRPSKRSAVRAPPPDRPKASDLAAGSTRSSESAVRRSSRETRENKRLKSVVKVMRRFPSTSTDSSDECAATSSAAGGAAGDSAGCAVSAAAGDTAGSATADAACDAAGDLAGGAAGGEPRGTVGGAAGGEAGGPAGGAAGGAAAGPAGGAAGGKARPVRIGHIPERTVESDSSFGTDVSTDDDIPLGQAFKPDFLLQPFSLSRTYVSDFSD